jgi:hypothetical protein
MFPNVKFFGGQTCLSSLKLHGGVLRYDKSSTTEMVSERVSGLMGI